MRHHTTRRVCSHLLACAAGVIVSLSAAPDGRAGRAGERAPSMSHSGVPGDVLLIDDFRRADGASALGTRWRRFTDRVMGGVSRADHDVLNLDDERCLRLTGRVSLANNGGFIQVALPLTVGEAPFDASGYDGIRVRVRGQGDGYYLHLKTKAALLPWQHYQAPLALSSGWQELEIPFAAFRPQSLQTRMDPSGLTRLGVVAAKRAFDADIAIARLEFYRRQP